MGTLDKYCPLLDKESGSAKCEGDACAWWMESTLDSTKNNCVIVLTFHNINSIRKNINKNINNLRNNATTKKEN